MDHSEAGRKGAIATKSRHGLTVCPCCGNPLLTDFYRENGHKGGSRVVALYGIEHMSAIGKLGGRPRRRTLVRSRDEA